MLVNLVADWDLYSFLHKLGKTRLLRLELQWMTFDFNLLQLEVKLLLLLKQLHELLPVSEIEIGVFGANRTHLLTEVAHHPTSRR